MLPNPSFQLSFYHVLTPYFNTCWYTVIPVQGPVLESCSSSECLIEPDVTMSSTSGVPRVISGDRVEERPWLSSYDGLVGLKNSVEEN